MAQTTCKLDGCTKKAKGRGYCSMHYSRVMATGHPGEVESRKEKQPQLCTVSECDRPAKSLGFCLGHYARYRRRGDAGGPIERASGPKECSIDHCHETSRSKGLCSVHYMAEWRGKDPAAIKRTMRVHDPVCTVQDCEAKHHAKGFCSFHYSRSVHGVALAAPKLKTARVGNCRGPQCADPIQAKGLCSAHYWQDSQGLQMTPKRVYEPKGGPCSVAECDRVAEVVGMCLRHRVRFLRGQEGWDEVIPDKAPAGAGYYDKHDYHIITVDGRQWREHRWNATQALGRPLEPNEDVHHVSSNKRDNDTAGPFQLDERGRLRSGNLEIWAHSHPRGAEVGPRMAWFVNEIERYAEVLSQELIDRLAGVVERRHHTS